MKVQVTADLIKKIADLARLELSDEEAVRYAEQVGKVIHYIDELSEVDVTGVAPMVQPFDVDTPLRADEPGPFAPGRDGSPRILECAPEVAADGFKVPQIIEGA